VENTSKTALEAVIIVFNDLAAFLADEPELAAATTSALLGSDPDVRELRLLVGTEINKRLLGALGPDVSPQVFDALTLAWSGAMLQVGFGHAPVEEMGARLGEVARLVMGVR
jgi:hypothetical protein